MRMKLFYDNYSKFLKKATIFVFFFIVYLATFLIYVNLKKLEVLLEFELHKL